MSSDPAAQSGFPARLKSRALGINRLFLVTVVIPTLLAVLYYGLIASDVYVSESRFVVRSPERQAASPLGLILKGAGFSRSQDDTYTVHDFVTSRDALKELNEKLDLKSLFGDAGIDLFSRFPGLDWDDSFEALYRYYQKHIVNIQLDATTSISVLSVRAYTGEDAAQINRLLLEMSEARVNELNERGRQDMIRFASAEVDAAERRAKAAALALSAFRNQKGVIDPERQSAIQLQQIAKLQDELISSKAQLVQLQMLAPSNPQIPVLQKRISTVEEEIRNETTKVAGGDRSLANKAAEYQRLALEREFADKQLAAAMVSLEQARNDAQRKQLYLERVVQPNVPDIAVEPRRIRGVLATIALGLIAWGVLTILIAGVREHRD